MIETRYSVRIDRPIHQVFEFVGTNVYVNHPRWESAVVEIRPITEGPVRVGSRAVMVRKGMGKSREVEYTVVDFEQDKAIGFRQQGKQVDFNLTFTFDPATGDQNATDFGARVRIQPKGFFRVMTPMLRVRSRKIAATLMGNVKRLIESEVPTTP
jgi:hypothetical protein